MTHTSYIIKFEVFLLFVSDFNKHMKRNYYTELSISSFPIVGGWLPTIIKILELGCFNCIYMIDSITDICKEYSSLFKISCKISEFNFVKFIFIISCVIIYIVGYEIVHFSQTTNREEILLNGDPFSTMTLWKWKQFELKSISILPIRSI